MPEKTARRVCLPPTAQKPFFTGHAVHTGPVWSLPRRDGGRCRAAADPAAEDRPGHARVEKTFPAGNSAGKKETPESHENRLHGTTENRCSSVIPFR